MSQIDRINRLRQGMTQRNLDAFLVSQPLNVYYLSAFRPMMWNIIQPVEDPEGFVLVLPDSFVFLCDDRYDATPAKKIGGEHARIESPASIATLCKPIQQRLAGRVKRIGYEAAGLIHSDATALFAEITGVEWVKADDLLTQQRVNKDAAEQALLRDAARVTDDACKHALGRLRIGMTEHDLAEEISDHLRKHSDGCSFNTIVAFGENSASPHYEPSHDRRLKKGDIVLMDFGSNYKGYMGDLTRMAVMGKADDKQNRIYALVLEAQKAVLNGLKPNMKGHDGDKMARDSFERNGVLDKFLHGTGHGVGLAIHEPPRLKPTFENLLAPGTVFTVEPGLYEAGWGGVRIEDVVIMQPSGPENITHAPKETLTEIAC